MLTCKCHNNIIDHFIMVIVKSNYHPENARKKNALKISAKFNYQEDIGQFIL